MERTMTLCKKLHELPLAATEWQQTTWCPDCEYYNIGSCGIPARIGTPAACPIDGKTVPVLEVPIVPTGELLRQAFFTALSARPETHPPSAMLEQAIRDQIMKRTGGRIQNLAVRMVENGVVIRGCVPCFYLKQLALRGVFDVVGSTAAKRIELDVDVSTVSRPTVTRGPIDRCEGEDARSRLEPQ
jgi:hypothetical protein